MPPARLGAFPHISELRCLAAGSSGLGHRLLCGSFPRLPARPSVHQLTGSLTTACRATVCTLNGCDRPEEFSTMSDEFRRLVARDGRNAAPRGGMVPSACENGDAQSLLFVATEEVEAIREY